MRWHYNGRNYIFTKKGFPVKLRGLPMNERVKKYLSETFFNINYFPPIEPRGVVPLIFNPSEAPGRVRFVPVPGVALTPSEEGEESS